MVQLMRRSKAIQPPGRLSRGAADPTSPRSPACSTRQRIETMLMTGSGKAARIHYLPGTFRLLSDGDHVVCAQTGTRIPLHELKYWSVERQEPYVDAEAALKAEVAATGR